MLKWKSAIHHLQLICNIRLLYFKKLTNKVIINKIIAIILSFKQPTAEIKFSNLFLFLLFYFFKCLINIDKSIFVRQRYTFMRINLCHLNGHSLNSHAVEEKLTKVAEGFVSRDGVIPLYA